MAAFIVVALTALVALLDAKGMPQTRWPFIMLLLFCIPALVVLAVTA